ncbi:MAG: hypothetical protein VKL59_01775 [Nostocaceae cyanobacterium]|nr:hypothetical protein [Nostocaceae cyanobacterium]
MFFRKITSALLTTVAILAISNTAIADSLITNGSGGNFSYELWQSKENNNNRYYLKIWKQEVYPDDKPLSIVHGFESRDEAVGYFDCYYAQKAVAFCPKL